MKQIPRERKCQFFSTLDWRCLRAILGETAIVLKLARSLELDKDSVPGTCFMTSLELHEIVTSVIRTSQMRKSLDTEHLIYPRSPSG